MKTNIKNPALLYPESSLLIAMAETAWAGNLKNEERRGQIDITPADFAFIPVILNEYDTARQTGKDKIGNKKLLFTKKIEGTFYLASIEKGNNQIGIITLWKKKSPIGCLMFKKIPQGT